MADLAFDTLGAARRLKAAGIESEHAEAIVEVMGESVNRLVTVERFDAGLAVLHTRIDSVQTELQASIDSVQTQLQAQIDGLSSRIDSIQTGVRAEIVRSQLIFVGIVIAANALMMTVLGILLTQGALM